MMPGRLGSADRGSQQRAPCGGGSEGSGRHWWERLQRWRSSPHGSFHLRGEESHHRVSHWWGRSPSLSTTCWTLWVNIRSTRVCVVCLKTSRVRSRPVTTSHSTWRLHRENQHDPASNPWSHPRSPTHPPGWWGRSRGSAGRQVAGPWGARWPGPPLMTS